MAFIKLNITEETSRNIYLDPDDLKTLDLEPLNPVTIKAGALAAEIRVLTGPGQRHISTGALKALSLPAVNGLRLKSEGSGSLQIGPLLGIMTTQGGRYKTPPYSSQGKLLQHFLTYGHKSGCLAFVFNPRGVNIGTRSITGLYLHYENDGTFTWQRHEFPLPDIVYDRILFRSFQRRKITGHLISVKSG